jgi:hypothetical protein
MQNLKSDPIKTVLTINVGFLVLYIITEHSWLLLIALFVGVIGIMSTYLTKKIDYLWMKLAYVLSLIIPNVLLTIVFYLFLFPIASLSKLLSKKDPLSLKNTKPSLFKNVDKEFKPDSFDNPW